MLALANTKDRIAVAEEGGRIMLLNARRDLSTQGVTDLDVVDPAGVEDLAFSPDGTRLASLNRDHVKKLHHAMLRAV